MNAPEKVKFVDPIAFVASIVDQCGANRDEAVDKVVEALRKDRALFDAVVEPMIRSGARELVDSVLRDRRSSISRAVISGSAPQRNLVFDKAMATIVEKRVVSIFDMAMPGNKTLGECTRKDLLNFADHQEKQAKTMLKNTRFYRSLAEKLKNEDVFVCTLKEDTVRALLVKAEQEA